MSDFNVDDRPVEKLNMKDIPLGDFIKLVSMAFNARMRKYNEDGSIRPGMENIKTMERPMLAIGKPGIGKTEIMRSVLMQKFNLPRESIVELRLGSMQDSDITGMPLTHAIGNDEFVTKFASLEVLPRPSTHPPYGILVLDELTTCNASVRTIALQLLDSSRAIGGYKLPNGWMIVALGNGPDDGADYEEIKSTIISRCAAYYVSVDWQLWKNWAVSAGVHDAVVGFLNQGNGHDLYSMAGRGEYDSQIVTPRTWEITSDMIHLAESQTDDHRIPDDLIEAVCCSGIGYNMGTKFSAFYRCKASLIPLPEIESGEAIKKYQKDSLSSEAMYLGQLTLAREVVALTVKHRDYINGLVQNFMKYANQDNFDTLPDEDANKIANILNFIVWYGGHDLAWAFSTLESIYSICVTQKVQTNRYLSMKNTKVRKKCPSFTEFVKENGAFSQMLNSMRRTV